MALIKPSYNIDRITLGEQIPLDTPLSVIIDTSEVCNFRCSYCFRSGEKDENWGFAAAEELMSMETFNTAIEQLSQFPQKTKSISLSGHGEPLCNPRLADMARVLKNSNVTGSIEMHTNASLLNEANIEKIANAGFTRIVVSLQGTNAAAYERVSDAIIDWDIFFSNLNRLYETKSDALKIHIKISNMALDSSNSENDKRMFYDAFGDVADSVYVEEATPLWRNKDIRPVSQFNKYGYNFGNINYCPIVFYKLWIAPDGEIYPCTNLPPPISLGNVRDTTLLQAWNSPKRISFLKEHLRLTRHGQSACLGCWVPINTVTSQADIIDSYKDAILGRLEQRAEGV